MRPSCSSRHASRPDGPRPSGRNRSGTSDRPADRTRAAPAPARGPEADSSTGSETNPGSGAATGAGTVARVEAPAALPPRPSDPSRYVREYEGGDCFFIHPLNISSASASIGIWLVAIGFRGVRDGVQNHVRFRASDQPEADHRRAMSRGQFHEDDRRRLGRGPKLQIDAFNLKLGRLRAGPSRAMGAARGRSARRRRWLRSQSLRVPEARGCLGEVPPPARGVRRARRSRPQLVFALASAQRLAASTGKPLAGDTLSPCCSTRSERAGRAWTSP